MTEFLNGIPRLAYATISGSRAYGIDVENSDTDIRGFYMESLEDLMGIKKIKEQYEDSESDTVIYSFKKFVKLLANGNPNIIELLGTRQKDRLYVNPAAQRLLDNTSMFLSKKIYSSFEGFATSLFYGAEKLWDMPLGQKNAMHCIRIYLMGVDILKNGEINTYREKEKDFLLSLRNGEISFRRFNMYRDELRYKMRREAFLLTRLPDKVDIDKVNEFVQDILFEYYNLGM